MAPPTGRDPGLMTLFLPGAVTRSVLPAEAGRRLGSTVLKAEKDWKKVEHAVQKLVRGVYPCPRIGASTTGGRAEIILNKWFTLRGSG